MKDRRDVATAPRPEPGRGGVDIVDQLRTTLERAGELLHMLETSLHRAKQPGGGPSGSEAAGSPEARLGRAEAHARELATQLVASERQAARLMNLYVAAHQLHASLKPDEVRATVGEIAVDLLGARKLVVLERGEGVLITLRRGLPAGAGPFGGATYSGGVADVDAALADGKLRLGQGSAPRPAAVIPLLVDGRVTGALVVLELLEHKGVLGPDDRDLLELLSHDAAAALLAARTLSARSGTAG